MNLQESNFFQDFYIYEAIIVIILRWGMLLSGHAAYPAPLPDYCVHIF